jgi:hypothetical protein
MDEALKSVDLRSKMLSGTLSGGGIVHLLTHAHAQHEFDAKSQSIRQLEEEEQQQDGLGATEWGELLDKFFVASKQLDDIHAVMTPMFALTIPTPRKVPLPPTEPFPIPQLMSTSIAPEDVDKIKVPPNGSNAAELREAVAKHNEGIEGCISKFNVQLESWRKNKGGIKRSRE